MTARQLQSPIVGAHWRPPAKQLLANLPTGAELVLVPEPDNPYDEWAIKVLVEPGVINCTPARDALAISLDGTGFTIEDLTRGEATQLGFVMSASNKKLASWASNQAIGAMMAEGPCSARLGFAPDGQALVIVEHQAEDVS